MAHYRSSLYGVAAVSHVPKASACSLLAPRVSPHQVSAVPGVSATSPALCMCTACLVRRLCMRGGGQSCDVATPHVLLFARACACLRRWCARQISLGRNRFGALHAGASASAPPPRALSPQAREAARRVYNAGVPGLWRLAGNLCSVRCRGACCKRRWLLRPRRRPGGCMVTRLRSDVRGSRALPGRTHFVRRIK